MRSVKYYNYILLISVSLPVVYFVFSYGIDEYGTGESAKQEDNLTSDHLVEEDDSRYPEVWIEVHDLSPGYGYGMVGEILDVIEQYPGSYTKVVLFVIPNHGNVRALHRYPGYVKKLKALEDAGYIIGLHGYRHFGDDNIYEFNTSKENATALLNMALEEFRVSNMSPPEYFAPPGWIASPEASAYLNEQFDYVYYADHIATKNGSLNYTSHEYLSYPGDTSNTRDTTNTSDTSNSSNTYTGDPLNRSKTDFLNTNETVFRLTLHIKSVNDGRGLQVLGEFLKWIETIKESRRERIET